jgi:SAM-dependent methyltransferase
MKADLDVAATLECEPELLPYLPEILQDFDTLGSEPSLLTELLESEGVIGNVRIALDLCCGKGAVAIELARRFGIRIDGIDAMEAFIESARTAATVAGVDHLCRFTTDDLCETVARPPGYDLVIFSSVGPILGGITSTVAHLVRPLRGLGWILIEDSILLPGAPVRPGFESHAQLEGTRRRIEGAGVEIVNLHLCGDEQLPQQHEADNRNIGRRAQALVERRPELADLVHGYLQRQLEECAYLEQWTRDVIWLLRAPAARVDQPLPAAT